MCQAPFALILTPCVCQSQARFCLCQTYSTYFLILANELRVSLAAIACHETSSLSCGRCRPPPPADWRQAPACPFTYARTVLAQLRSASPLKIDASQADTIHSAACSAV